MNSTPHEIQPRQPVLVAALPVPANGITILTDAIERVYGTGDTTVEFDKDAIRFRAPAEGFEARIAEPLPASDDPGTMRIREMDATDDGLAITYEFAAHTVVTVGNSLARWFTDNGGVNYVTARIASPGNDPGPYELTVRRRGTPSSERLHLAALDRIAQLEKQLADAGLTPTADTTQED